MRWRLLRGKGTLAVVRAVVACDEVLLARGEVLLALIPARGEVLLAVILGLAQDDFVFSLFRARPSAGSYHRVDARVHGLLHVVRHYRRMRG